MPSERLPDRHVFHVWKQSAEEGDADHADLKKFSRIDLNLFRTLRFELDDLK